MKEPVERKTKSPRRPSNIIFNLLALALLLTVIVFLHQILKKPKQTIEQQTKQEIKAVAPLPSATPPPAPETAAKPAAQVVAPTPVETKAEAVVEVKKEEEPVIQKPAKKRARAKKVSFRAEKEISPPELDGEEARRNYLEENRRLSSGEVKIEKSPTRPAKTQTSELDREAARRLEAPSSYDLDDETARQRYLEENRRLSRLVNTGPKQQPPTGSSGTDEYIPFEDR